MGLRDEKKQQQRQAILDTALALFRERGFVATRVQDVTERLRISEGTFFNYFPSKQAVLEAAAIDLIDRAIARLSLEVTDDARRVTERIEELVRAFAHDFAGDREFAGLLALNAQLWLLRTRQQTSHDLLTCLFAEGQRRGEIRADVSAAQLAELFSAVVLVTISNWLLAPGELSPMNDELLADDLDERVLRAWSVLSAGATAPLGSSDIVGGPLR